MASEPQARALLQDWLAPYFQGGMLRYYVGNLTPKLAVALLAERQSPEHSNETADAAGTDIAPAGAVPPLRGAMCAGDVVVSPLPGAAGDHSHTPSTLAAIPPEVQARVQDFLVQHFGWSADDTAIPVLARFVCAEWQQQRVETLREVQHIISRLRLDDSVTDTFIGGIATALMAITGALDAAVPGARER